MCGRLFLLVLALSVNIGSAFRRSSQNEKTVADISEHGKVAVEDNHSHAEAQKLGKASKTVAATNKVVEKEYETVAEKNAAIGKKEFVAAELPSYSQQALRGKELLLANCERIGLLIEGASEPRHRVQVRVWQRFLAHQYGASCVVSLLDPDREEDEGEFCDQSFCSISTKKSLVSCINMLSSLRKHPPGIDSVVVVYMAHGDVGQLMLRGDPLGRDEWIKNLEVLHQLTDKLVVYVDACHSASMFTTRFLRNGLDILSMFDEKIAGLPDLTGEQRYSGSDRLTNDLKAFDTVRDLTFSFGEMVGASELWSNIVMALRMCRMASQKALDDSGLPQVLAKLVGDSKLLGQSPLLHFDVEAFWNALRSLEESQEASDAIKNTTSFDELYNQIDIREVSKSPEHKWQFFLNVVYLDPVAFACKRGKALSGRIVGERIAYAAARALAAKRALTMLPKNDDLLRQMCDDKEESCFALTSTVPSLSSCALPKPQMGSYFMKTVVRDLSTHAGHAGHAHTQAGNGNMLEHINRVHEASPIDALPSNARRTSEINEFYDVATGNVLTRRKHDFPEFVPISFGNMLETSIADIFPKSCELQDQTDLLGMVEPNHVPGNIQSGFDPSWLE